MYFKVDKGLPIPSSGGGGRYAKLLAEMDEGDSVLFPWDKDPHNGEFLVTKKKQKISHAANGFMGFAYTKGCKTKSRTLEDGRRVWLIKKGEPDETL